MNQHPVVDSRRYTELIRSLRQIARTHLEIEVYFDTRDGSLPEYAQANVFLHGIHITGHEYNV